MLNLLAVLVLQVPTLPLQEGVLVSAADVAALPVAGGAWERMLADADVFRASPRIVLADQDDKGDSYALAAALVWARTVDVRYRDAVEAGLLGCIGTEDDDFPGENNTSLELSRNLAAIAIAADVLVWSDPALEARFRAWLGGMSLYEREDGRSIVSTHEDRPNNWGTHAGASRVAIAVYLGDQPEIERCAKVLKGWLGDRSAYSGFDYGDLSWQADPSKPVGVNPPGARLHGAPVGGALPDDQRRCEEPTPFPDAAIDWMSDSSNEGVCQTNYSYEALQGVLLQALILRRRGYDTFRWEKKAIGRAVVWLTTWNAQFPDGDDRWQTFVLNRAYPTLGLPEVSPAPVGKSLGYTDWLVSGGTWPGL
jgi:hypothetical protein